jgi:hypothetical protein
VRTTSKNTVLPKWTQSPIVTASKPPPSNASSGRSQAGLEVNEGDGPEDGIAAPGSTPRASADTALEAEAAFGKVSDEINGEINDMANPSRSTPQISPIAGLSNAARV